MIINKVMHCKLEVTALLTNRAPVLLQDLALQDCHGRNHRDRFRYDGGHNQCLISLTWSMVRFPYCIRVGQFWLRAIAPASGRFRHNTPWQNRNGSALDHLIDIRVSNLYCRCTRHHHTKHHDDLLLFTSMKSVEEGPLDNIFGQKIRRRTFEIVTCADGLLR